MQSNLSILAAVSTAIALAGAARAGTVSPSPEFLRYWKSGLAELSSYAVSAERYGEQRKGEAVLIFVYEEINGDTRIKVESERVPKSKRVPVLKLNHALKFSTGIYDYSIMTSVFAGLSGPGVDRRLQPRKISFSSQEWCGNVFHQLIPGPKSIRSEIHSYFEAEGDFASAIAYPEEVPPESVFYEDELPILVRELDGTVQATGQLRKLRLVPGLWERRKRHVPLTLGEGILTKVGSETWAGPAGAVSAVKWTLAFQGDSTTWHVEAAPPRKLLGWENTKGEKGELIASIRDTYWKHNHNADLPLRKQLGLSYGVGD